MLRDELSLPTQERGKEQLEAYLDTAAGSNLQDGVAATRKEINGFPFLRGVLQSMQQRAELLVQMGMPEDVARALYTGFEAALGVITLEAITQTPPTPPVSETASY